MKALLGAVLLCRGIFFVLFELGVFPGASAIAGSPVQYQDLPGSSVHQAGAGEHVSRTEAAVSGITTNPRDFLRRTEVAPPARGTFPTRSSFIAIWSNVNGATGYRLDVSTKSKFTSYVSGYHDLDVGNLTSRVVSGLGPGTTYYYRVRAYNAAGTSADSNVMTATTMGGAGLVINATLDSSITGDPNAAAIESVINEAISIFESLFSDSITVSIFFRYSTTRPDGTLLGSNDLARSNWVFYTESWDTFINALKADATTSNDDTANASLPTTPLTSNIKPSSANGRAIGLNTPPSMFADSSVGPGGPYDGIVTLNSAQPFQFTRPTSASNYDALRSTEHEIDEVLGFGSYLTLGGSDLRPQDLFSWSSAGSRNLSTAGSRYFSIDTGSTDLVDFNQNSNGDFGDWLSASCPQTNPYVQNAFSCKAQFSDVTSTSPEGINLDVIGYHLAPVLKITAVSRSPTGHLLISGQAVPGSLIHIQASPDLIMTFTNITSVMADSTGAFQFDDASAVNLQQRFYRASY